MGHLLFLALAFYIDFVSVERHIPGRAEPAILHRTCHSWLALSRNKKKNNSKTLQ